MIYGTVDNIGSSSIKQNSSIMNQHDDLSDCSSQSVLSAMDKFFKSITTMNETVMIPCRLLDMDVTETKDVPKLLTGNEDPYTFYTLLNDVKNDLMWGPSIEEDGEEEDDDKRLSQRHTNGDRWVSSKDTKTSSSNTQQNGQTKGHFRRQSTLSMISVASTSSDGESESCSDAGDSGLDVEEEPVDNVKSTMSDLKSHLLGLHSCLSSLTETAQYITSRYQEEVNK